jgi:hypothetical protein
MCMHGICSSVNMFVFQNRVVVYRGRELRDRTVRLCAFRDIRNTLIYISVFHTFCVAEHFSGQKFVAEYYRQWRTQDFFFGGAGSTNSVEDRGQREWGSGGGSHLVRGTTQFANE